MQFRLALSQLDGQSLALVSGLTHFTLQLGALLRLLLELFAFAGQLRLERSHLFDPVVLLQRQPNQSLVAIVFQRLESIVQLQTSRHQLVLLGRQLGLELNNAPLGRLQAGAEVLAELVLFKPVQFWMCLWRVRCSKGVVLKAIGTFAVPIDLSVRVLFLPACAGHLADRYHV